ncbi:MAG: DUF1579 domain-containing protein [Deltaproteobacteria bacterium]|nr:DUF1579 domain-containing protein [Deltaproteobacteria bacterium]
MFRSKITLAGALLLAPLSTQAGEPEKPGAAAPAAAEQKPDPMMEAWMKAATPGPQHQLLKSLAGNFTVASKAWMDPKAPPMESAGKMKAQMTLGDRFLHQTLESQMMGQPFTGAGLIGFDNVKGKFVSTWSDTMGTMIMMFEGTADKTGNVITMTGEYLDPMTKKKKKMRTVMKVESADKQTFELYDQDKKGKEFKAMEAVYTRAPG